MTKLNQESGRSMVEMLGVLAIIGVLSIGGIAGYTMAMNRYRANDILDTAAKLYVIGQTKDGGMGADATLTDIGITDDTVQGAGMSYTHVAGADGGYISLTTIPGGVGQAIDSILGETDKCNGGSCTLVMTGGKFSAS